MRRYKFNLKSWIPTKKQWIQAGESIQEEESRRISEFVFREDCKAVLVGRILLRYTVCKSTGLRWDEIHFRRSDKGKPIIDALKMNSKILESLGDFGYNISHNGSYVVAAADQELQVGVDVMNITDRQGGVENFFNLMKRNFTPNEWNCIKSQNRDSDKMKMFYRHWCLKESFVKAIGKGIGYSLQKLDFDVDKDSILKPSEIYDKTTLKIEGISKQNWKFEETMVDEDHCCAVATEIENTGDNHEEVQRSFELVSFEQIEQLFVAMSPVNENFWIDFEQKPSKHKT